MSNCVNFSAGGGVPIGTIISFMGTTPPADYLACDGSTKNITDYPQLAHFFEVQFGSKNYFGGDGTTTFAVPDLKGEFLRGTGTNGHACEGNGANVGVHQAGTVIPHAYGTQGGAAVGCPASGVRSATQIDANKGQVNRYYSLSGTIKTDSSVLNSYTARPTNTSVLYCIKAIAYTD